MRLSLDLFNACFIDAHVHIESSMLTPCEFARIACRHGTVATGFWPPLKSLMYLAGGISLCWQRTVTPLQIFFGAPSCVPATPFETSGAGSKVNNWTFCFKIKSLPIYQKWWIPGGTNNAPDIRQSWISKRYGFLWMVMRPWLTGEDVHVMRRQAFLRSWMQLLDWSVKPKWRWAFYFNRTARRRVIWGITSVNQPISWQSDCFAAMINTDDLVADISIYWQARAGR